MTGSTHAPMPEGEEKPPPGTSVMAVLRWTLLVLIALAALFTLTLGLRTGGHPSHPNSAAADAGQPQTLYTCPMHPQVVSEAPEDCPICGMTLVPRKAQSSVDAGEAPPGTGMVEVAPEQVQALGVRIEVARREPLSRLLTLYGRIAADPARTQAVRLRADGYVEKLVVSQPGEKVRAGSVLATVYSDELMRLQRELLQAKGFSPQLAESARQRLSVLGIAESDITRIEAANAPERTIPLRSPMSGYVTGVQVNVGDRVGPDASLFEVSDLSRVWLFADVYERDLGAVRVGQRGKLKLDAYPNDSFDGVVDLVGAGVDPGTRTLSIRFTFKNADGRLKPGMFGRVSVDLGTTEGVTVPEDAVIDTGDHRYVYVEVGPGKFAPRVVTLGQRASGRVQIASGVAEGERVATRGNFFLDAESRLRTSISTTVKPARPMGESQATPETGPDCDREFDAAAAPMKYQQCKQCERVHRGMGSMEADCKNAIAKPWRSP